MAITGAGITVIGVGTIVTTGAGAIITGIGTGTTVTGGIGEPPREAN
jgi:hypothetical protein